MHTQIYKHYLLLMHPLDPPEQANVILINCRASVQTQYLQQQQFDAPTNI